MFHNLQIITGKTTLWCKHRHIVAGTAISRNTAYGEVTRSEYAARGSNYLQAVEWNVHLP